MKYREDLKTLARNLRNNMTPQEVALWQHLRQKQILNIQFYRQKPVENFIVDFYAPTVDLVIEIDGGQHFEVDHEKSDKERDQRLLELGLTVLRFNNVEVNTNLEGILDEIYEFITQKKSL